MDGQFIGLDVGGTKIASATLQDGKLATRELIKTNVADSDALVAQLVELIGHLRTDDTVAAGVGLPSIIEFETGRIAHSVNIPLQDLPLRKLLTEQAGIPVYIENDASCAALAEAFDEDGSLVCPNLVMFTVGTGVGGGMVFNGRLYRGATSAAEIGHTVIGLDLEEGAPVPEGKHPLPGTLEYLAAGRALDRLAEREAKQEEDSFLGKRLARGRRGHRPRRRRRRQGRRRRRAARARHPRPAARHRDRQRDQPLRPAGDRDRRRRLDRGRPPARARAHASPSATRCRGWAGTRRSGSRATAPRPACSARRWSPRRRRRGASHGPRRRAHRRLPPDRRARPRRRPPHGRARRHQRHDRLVLLPGLRLAERVRRDPRQGQGRLLRAAPDRRGVDLQAALLPGHERADHALPDRGGRRRGPGLHADRPRRDGAAPPSPDPPRRRRARPDGLPDRGAAALRLRARRARGRDAPARRAVPLAGPDARARGGDRAHDGPRADGSSAAAPASTRPSTSPRATRRRSCSSASRRTTSAAPTPSARPAAAFDADRRLLAPLGRRSRATRGAGARWCCARR